MFGEKTKVRIFLALLLAPALVLILALVAFPLVYNVILSLSNADSSHVRDWRLIGFGQYVSILGQQPFWAILLKTVIWTGASILFHLAIGVLLAVVLHQKFIRGKLIWRIALILPWALPQYIAALTWRGMFNYEDGAVNLLIAKYLHLSPVQWMASPLEAFLAVLIANVWLGYPLMMVIALAALQSIPDELYEAAEVDGASKWFQFWNITVPSLWPVLFPAIVLSAIWTFNNINVVWLVSNGGEPADATHTLATYVYKAAFSMGRFGWSAALSIVIFAILFVFSGVLLRRMRNGISLPHAFASGSR
jgi:arabinogalactan oligomer/maltooligosaccharide transport system permease protein